MTSIFIESPNYQYIDMFVNYGLKLTRDYKEAEYVLFTGGEDVSPRLYGEGKHPTTNTNSARDVNCVKIFTDSQAAGKKLLGICRGSQFLTVMAGGSLFQNVSGHGRDHTVTDVATGQVVPVSSTHHQMMDSSTIKDRVILATAGIGHKTPKEREIPGQFFYTDFDEEFNWYPTINAFVCQPHPEFYNSEHACQVYYFNQLEKCFGVQKN
jgi:hypothetical protein